MAKKVSVFFMKVSVFIQMISSDYKLNQSVFGFLPWLDVKNTKPTNQITLHLTFRSVPVLPELFGINTKNANFFPKNGLDSVATYQWLQRMLQSGKIEFWFLLTS